MLSFKLNGNDVSVDAPAGTRTVREAVGVFNRPEDLQSAIDELLSSGFHRAELSLLASEHAVEEKLGHRYEKISALADHPTVPRAAYVSTEAIGDAEGGLIGGLVYVGAIVAAGAIVASGGTVAAAIAAAVLAGGTGGFVGSILAKWVGDRHASFLQEQMDRGGLLLWARTWDSEDEKRAVEILGRHSASDVHVHALPTEIARPDWDWRETAPESGTNCRDGRTRNRSHLRGARRDKCGSSPA